MTFLAPICDSHGCLLPALVERLARLLGLRFGRARRRAAKACPAGRSARGAARPRLVAEPSGRLSEFDYNYYVALERGAVPAIRPRPRAAL